MHGKLSNVSLQIMVIIRQNNYLKMIKTVTILWQGTLDLEK